MKTIDWFLLAAGVAVLGVGAVVIMPKTAKAPVGKVPVKTIDVVNRPPDQPINKPVSPGADSVEQSVKDAALPNITISPIEIGTGVLLKDLNTIIEQPLSPIASIIATQVTAPQTRPAVRPSVEPVGIIVPTPVQPVRSTVQVAPDGGYIYRPIAPVVVSSPVQNATIERPITRTYQLR